MGILEARKKTAKKEILGKATAYAKDYCVKLEAALEVLQEFDFKQIDDVEAFMDSLHKTGTPCCCLSWKEYKFLVGADNELLATQIVTDNGN